MAVGILFMKRRRYETLISCGISEKWRADLLSEQQAINVINDPDHQMRLPTELLLS